MPVVPSFSGYAAKPDLAGAYLGARRADIAAFQAATEAQLGRQRLAQDAAQAQARIALGQQELESRRVQNEMELAARKETQEREHLRKQQEAEILKSYRDTQIGMQERRLKIAEAAEAQRIAEVAAAFDQQQEYNRLAALGMPPDEIVRTMGPKTPGFATALGEMTRPQQSETASDRELRYKILQAKKEDALIKYGLHSPEYEAAAKDIDRQISEILPQRWMVPPESIPFGTNAPIPLGLPSTNAPSPSRLRVLSIQRQ